MVDRALTFADPQIINMLQNDFVPVAIDQWYQRRQQDAEGDFYRKIAGQGPRKDFNSTTQGRYICTPDGKLIAFNNNRGPERIGRLMREALDQFDAASLESVGPIESEEVDERYDQRPPKNGLILRVNCKVLGGHRPTDDWTAVFHDAVGRDNVWFTEQEKHELAKVIADGGGDFPKELTQRIARFHLNDFTRGEPPRWRPNEVKSIELTIAADGRIDGSAHLETADHKRGYRVSLLGQIKLTDGEFTQLDMVAKGNFWGTGPYTHFAPEGEFPVAIAFRLADGSDPSDGMIPGGAKGNRHEYFSAAD
ncbi:MAG: hypothetical protein HKN47_02715 [Pirellulaceae bacterium]|nr:hypothetical protein [Pirellulaceae bacterium]